MMKIKHLLMNQTPANEPWQCLSMYVHPERQLNNACCTVPQKVAMGAMLVWYAANAAHSLDKENVHHRTDETVQSHWIDDYIKARPELYLKLRQNLDFVRDTGGLVEINGRGTWTPSKIPYPSPLILQVRHST